MKEPKPIIKQPDNVSTGLNTKQNVYKVATTEKRWGSSTDSVTCFRCRIAGYLALQCKFKESTCNECGKNGHLKRVCRTLQKRLSKHIIPDQSVKCKKRRFPRDCCPYALLFLLPKNTTAIESQVGVDNCVLYGDRHKCINVNYGRNHLQTFVFREELSTALVRLCTYSKEPIPVVSCTNIKVSYDAQTVLRPLNTVQDDGPTLLGRNWLQKITLNWSKIYYTPSSGMQDLLEMYKELFLERQDTLQAFQEKICVSQVLHQGFARLEQYLTR